VAQLDGSNMLDASKPGTPDWWLRRLEKKLRDRQKGLRRLDDYYDGRHRLLFSSEKFRNAFGGLFDDFADNWCPIVVDAVEDRLHVEGFRFGDEQADRDAWRIWQANALDDESHLGQQAAILKAEAALIVWNNPRDERTPKITVEDPAQVVVEMVPGTRRERAAALKVWLDDWTGHEMATLYLPDGLYKYEGSVTAGAMSSGLVLPAGVGTFSSWRPREVAGEPWPLPNPLRVVPVVPLRNRERLLQPGRSEIANVIPLQDGVNKLIADMLVASEFVAWPQRWATGLEVPRDEKTGQPVEAFNVAFDRLMWAKKSEARFGNFDAADLQNFVVGVEMLVQHIASQSATPPHYFYLKGDFPSGESILSAESSLTAKAGRKARSFGESYEEVERLAFAVLDDPRSGFVGAETIWRDFERRVESVVADAATKRQSLGVPWAQLMEDLGYSPTQVERMRVERTRDMVEQAAFAPPTAIALPGPLALPAGS
jgi:hypothetical protein